MQRIGLGAWKDAFEKSLPQKCVSIAAIRTTTPQDLGRLPFKLEPAHMMQVMKALKKEPLDTEIAGGGGLGGGTAAPAAPAAAAAAAVAADPGDDAMARRRKLLAGK